MISKSYLSAQEITESGIGNFDHFDEFGKDGIFGDGEQRDVGKIIGNRHRTQCHHVRSVTATTHSTYGETETVAD